MLIEDVKPLILGSLSELDLARAGACCREFQRAYRIRLAEERQKLVLLPEDIWGKPVVRTLCRLLQHTVCGPGVYSDMYGFCPWEGFVHAEGDVHQTRQRSSLVAIVIVAENDGHLIDSGIFSRHSRVKMLDVPKHAGVVIWGMHFRESPGNEAQGVGRFKAALHSAPAVLGLLLAACTGGREAEPAVWQYPITHRLSLRSMPEGAEGLREAGRVIAPLRQFAKSVVIEWPPDPRRFWRGSRYKPYVKVEMVLG
jgi:hypothetical protein